MIMQGKVAELPEVEQSFKDKFPDPWVCPFCMAGQEMHEHIPRAEILKHVSGQHPAENSGKVTWKGLYTRMSMVGGL